MLQSVHAEITRQAVGQLFSARALDLILASNIAVDALWNQLGHDELHVDNNAFDSSHAYMARQRALIGAALERGQAEESWQAFGRLAHTAQDFYSHTNYVDLWLARQPTGRVPAPSEIDPQDAALLESPLLRSGRSYLPFGALSFIPGIRDLVAPLLPLDSHARMNLDSAERGPMFEYAFRAAVKRTKYEYDAVTRRLSGPLLRRFRGLNDRSSGGHLGD
jgi:hypothetical protein